MPEAQGSLPPGSHVLYVRRTRTSLGRAVLTTYHGTTGSPSLKHLLDTYSAKLTTEEKAFLDNETDALCKLLDDHQVCNNSPTHLGAWGSEGGGGLGGRGGA